MAKNLKSRRGRPPKKKIPTEVHTSEEKIKRVPFFTWLSRKISLWTGMKQKKVFCWVFKSKNYGIFDERVFF